MTRQRRGTAFFWKRPQASRPLSRRSLVSSTNALSNTTTRTQAPDAVRSYLQEEVAANLRHPAQDEGFCSSSCRTLHRQKRRLTIMRRICELRKAADKPFPSRKLACLIHGSCSLAIRMKSELSSHTFCRHVQRTKLSSRFGWRPDRLRPLG